MAVILLIRYILANEINCRFQIIPAVYAVNVNSCLRHSLTLTGVEVEVIRKIGVVSDYYNLIHRHNLNNYFLCKIKSFGYKYLTQDEIEDFHLSTLKLTYEEAATKYDLRREFEFGRLIANRKLSVMMKAKEIECGGVQNCEI